MLQTKHRLHLHRTIITLICLALFIILIQGVTYFGRYQQSACFNQTNELAHTLMRQVTYNLEPLMQDNGGQSNQQVIQAMLQHLSQQKRILDAAVYDVDGTLISHSGDSVTIRNRLALDDKRAGGDFNHQVVEMIQSKDGPVGFLRITLDTHILATEAEQADNTTNLLRLMLIMALVIGIVLSNTLLQHRSSRWKNSPFLLTANRPITDDAEEIKNPVPPDTDACQKQRDQAVGKEKPLE